MDFDAKIKCLIGKVTERVQVDIGDRLSWQARKFKFVVNGPLPNDEAFPEGFRDFEVIHHYLQQTTKNMQIRLRKRGRKGKFTYIHTLRKLVSGQNIEVKTPLSHRDYSYLLTQSDPSHFPVYKTRRCFLYQHQFYQLDIYKQPAHDRCMVSICDTYDTHLGYLFSS